MMLFMHDVWVNWFEGEENGYSVCHFHEWRKEDRIELLDQIPLLYITKSLYNYIENDLHELPERLLNKIYNQSFIRKGAKKTPLTYACVVTDGTDILVFDTRDYKIPIRKSRLIPRQEQIVYDLIKKTKPGSFDFNVDLYKKDYHILSMEPELIFGLTRRERQLKLLLMMCLDQLRMKNNLEELRYWLTEWNPKKYPFIRFMDEETVWQALYNGLKKGWSQIHEELGRKMIKGYPFLERMWELEQSQKEKTTELK